MQSVAEKLNAELEGVCNQSPVPSKYPEPYVATLLGKVNGCAGDTCGDETGVIVKALVLLSMKRLDWQVNNCVPVTAVGGVVLGVKAAE